MDERRTGDSGIRNRVSPDEDAAIEEPHSVPNCSVCRERMPTSPCNLALGCGHAYHGKCIVPWLKRHDTCPECRMPYIGGTTTQAPPTALQAPPMMLQHAIAMFDALVNVYSLYVLTTLLYVHVHQKSMHSLLATFVSERLYPFEDTAFYASGNEPDPFLPFVLLRFYIAQSRMAMFGRIFGFIKIARYAGFVLACFLSCILVSCWRLIR